MNHLLWIVISAVAFATAARAEELVMDRPDAMESSSVMGRGLVQSEVGSQYSGEGDDKSHEVPQTLLRFGVLDWAELRLGWNGYAGGDDPEGAGDGEIGTKTKICNEDGSVPDAALLAGVSLPWGDDELTSVELDPGFRFSMSHTLSDTFSLCYNLGVEWATEDDSTLGSFIYTVALGAGISEKVGAFIEIFGDEGSSAEGSSQSLDGGFTYLVRENVQLDILSGVGLSDSATDWFVGTGLSCRFPN